jgi:hypothetical protein
MSDASGEQQEICARFNVAPIPALPELKVGVARNVREELTPLNGMRHLPSGDSTGWFIWAGSEMSTDSDFFVPLHVQHLRGWCPQVLPYLALPPGWRFLIAPGYEDAWSDPDLLIGN